MPPVLVPVLFAERQIAHDLARLPDRAAIELARLRRQIEREGGLPTSHIKRCEAEGPDGTRLPDCFKTYVPWDEDRWGLVMIAVSHPTRTFALRAFAYGLRHPTGTTASVYRIADRRLGGV
ncbi:MAG: hypothetical protein Q8O56_03530 [Solirubrobacteraceae bacterium]|nr:hypothetical protein [Solirubrobacteraceae bacterium]